MGTLLPRGQLRDDLAQGGQTGVDGDTLARTLSGCAGVLQSFTSRQVDKVELAVDGDGRIGAGGIIDWGGQALVLGRGRSDRGGRLVALDKIQTKDGVRSRRLGVDGGGIGLTNGGTEVERTDQVVKGIDVDLVETGENNATFGILANGDGGTFLRRGGIGDEQISQLFVVNLASQYATG